MPRTAPPATNTGSKDAKGRTIYQRPSGTLFVKSMDASGQMKRIPPAKGAASRESAVLTGRMNALGRPTWITTGGAEKIYLTSKTGKTYYSKPATGTRSPRKAHVYTAAGRSNARGFPIFLGPSGNVIQRVSAKTGKTYYGKPYTRTAASVAEGRAIRTARAHSRKPQFTSSGFTNRLGRQVMLSPAGHYYALNASKPSGQVRIKKSDVAGHFLNF